VGGAVELRPELGGEAFLRPAGVESIEIDPATGQLASLSCPQRERIAISRSLAPTVECFTHQPNFPLLAAYESPEQEVTSGDLPLHSASLPLSDASREPTPPRRTAPISIAIPATQETQIETNRNGRTRLTNEMRIVSAPQR
jgi:hypothetical protein